MKKDYPDEEDLKLIREWNMEDLEGWIDFVLSLWWMDYGVSWTKRRVKPKGLPSPDFDYYKLTMSTGGWSGNESIIDAMSQNFMWHIIYWSHRRGGHYVFEVPVKYIKK